jgi:hypothetical protein
VQAAYWSGFVPIRPGEHPIGHILGALPARNRAHARLSGPGCLVSVSDCALSFGVTAKGGNDT